jgi:hypothetical protein
MVRPRGRHRQVLAWQFVLTISTETLISHEWKITARFVAIPVDLLRCSCVRWGWSAVTTRLQHILVCCRSADSTGFWTGYIQGKGIKSCGSEIKVHQVITFILSLICGSTKKTLTYKKFHMNSLNKPIPPNWVPLEQQMFLQLVTTLSVYYETRKFVTVFTTARHLSLSWLTPTTPSHLVFLRFILILSSHLRLPVGPFPSDLTNHNLPCTCYMSHPPLPSFHYLTNIFNSRPVNY